MKLEMTERDKKLLIGLAIGVIVVCIGYWGILPIIGEINIIDSEIEVQSEKEQVNSMKLVQLPMLEMDNKAYEEDILQARSNFYKMLTSDEIDKIFTGKALNHNLWAYEMNIIMPKEPAELEPYKYSDRALNVEEEDNGKSSSDDSDSLFGGFEGEENITGIYSARITMKLSGEQEDMDAFLKELAGEGIKIRLVSFRYTDNRNVSYGEGSSFDVIMNRVLDVELEIYMCEE